MVVLIRRLKRDYANKNNDFYFLDLDADILQQKADLRLV